jgi:hypothetical protein
MATSEPKPEIFTVREPWATTVDGGIQMINAGDTFRAGHPLLKGNEHRVVPLKVTYDQEREKTEAAERKAAADEQRKADEAAAKAAADEAKKKADTADGEPPANGDK